MHYSFEKYLVRKLYNVWDAEMDQPHVKSNNLYD